MTRLEARLRSAERALFAHCGVEPSEHLVHAGSTADAPRLRVLAFGSGAPVVCLHAASWFGAHWAPLCAQLPGRRLYCVDMPGHGLSDAVDYPDRELRAFQVRLFASPDVDRSSPEPSRPGCRRRTRGDMPAAASS